MSSTFTAHFAQAPEAVFELLADVPRHNRILPFCTGVAVTGLRTLPDGTSEVSVHHRMAIARIALDANVKSVMHFRADSRAFSLVSRLGVKGDDGLRATGAVVPHGAGSELRMTLDTSGMPLRYRLVLIDAVQRRAFDKFVEKLRRRANELYAAG